MLVVQYGPEKGGARRILSGRTSCCHCNFRINITIEFKIVAGSPCEIFLSNRSGGFICFRHLKPGGTLVYSTCTVARAENEELAAWAAAACPDLVPSPLRLPSHWPSHMARFGEPSAGVVTADDTISFFCCKFTKIVPSPVTSVS
jgi:hypothetical protein